MINDAVRGYFGFERLPFDRSIPVGALFASASHPEAVGRIAYGIDTRQITVITGEVGAGKTVAVRAAAARLDASRHQLITIPNPQVGARGIHHAVVTALGGVPRFHHATLIPQAAGHLAAELAERGRLPVLLIDEAHLLSHDQLEAIRMLTSAQLDSASPLAVLEHPGFGGDSILPRCSRLGDCCLPRYRRMAEPRSDHFSAFVLSNICPAALSICPPDAGLRPARKPPGGLGISSSGTPVLRRGFPGLVKGDAQRHRLRRRRRP